ncbi:hypothetical protein [Leadbetterella byssophila]|uniref:Uncharacterized protein n=1 Tax=Leadbetterella byssophila (strain DSM 17132 / JCM 16389 / KACC 11308 / NBRC 106382 / 4M15) TaxID=649349 RepID=E4RZP5_LEAB4|nr:hypothetical protein [Leadbetterella byssophila]ADQ18288.1 hypothetical protein Lbys_2626 [Leadbetterella byssophila DSM 17132]
MKKLLFALQFVFYSVYSQSIKVTTVNGLKDKDANYLLDFMDVSLQKFHFEGDQLIGKSPTILIKEFRDGKLVRTDTLLNGKGDAKYLQIKEAKYSFSFFTEIRNEKLRTFIRHSSYGAGKREFALNKDKYGYALKDFFGAKQELLYDAKDQIPLLAIITPHDQGNGFASYCEVVQTDILPEDLGKHFGIPHYFLVYISF